MKITLAILRAGFAFALVGTSLLLAADAPAVSQSVGSLSGRVQNLATGDYLEGANVSLEGTSQSARTARDGSFYFSAVPAGDYRLTVSYTGLDTQTVAAAIAPGQSVRREVALTSKIYGPGRRGHVRNPENRRSSTINWVDTAVEGSAVRVGLRGWRASYVSSLPVHVIT